MSSTVKPRLSNSIRSRRLFENRIIRNNKKEINSFCTPKEYSETSVLEGLGVGTIQFSNKLWGRLTSTKEKPRFQSICICGVEKDD